MRGAFTRSSGPEAMSASATRRSSRSVNHVRTKKSWYEATQRNLAPVFCGDTICAESEVLSVRLSESRSNQGVVTVKTVGKKADQEVFMSFKRTILVPMRPSDKADCKGSSANG